MQMSVQTSIPIYLKLDWLLSSLCFLQGQVVVYLYMCVEGEFVLYSLKKFVPTPKNIKETNGEVYDFVSGGCDMWKYKYN